MSGTMKTALGPHYKIDDTPRIIKGFFNEEDLFFLVDVCDHAQQMSRLSVSRITKTTYSCDMPAINSVQNDFQLFFSEHMQTQLVAKSNAYYVFQQGATFPLRTLSKFNDVTVFCFLGQQDAIDVWPLRVSLPVSHSERHSPYFFGGSIYDEELALQICESHQFLEFLPEPGDVVIFSGTNCFHYFVEESPNLQKVLALNFSAGETF